jgi:hypothetical protein
MMDFSLRLKFSYNIFDLSEVQVPWLAFHRLLFWQHTLTFVTIIKRAQRFESFKIIYCKYFLYPSV